jgi:hypothetical protein
MQLSILLAQDLPGYLPNPLAAAAVMAALVFQHLWVEVPVLQ